MTPLQPHRLQRPAAAARGVSMLEALIAMLMISIWALASAGLHSNALRLQKSAANRALAVTLATDLGEAMDANRSGANDGDYALADTSTASAAGADCTASACTPAELATYDLGQWTQRAIEMLPIKSMKVTKSVSAGLTQYTILISWNETRGRQKYTTTRETTEVLSYSLSKLIHHGP